MYELPPGVEIRIDGHALLSAIRYELEKLRCSACGQILTVGLPDGVGEEKYSARARSVFALSRYFLGVPGYRFQGYPAMLGVPGADATQWDQIEKVGDCADVVFEQMEKAAAQGELVFQDDTAVRILSLMKENLEMLVPLPVAGLMSVDDGYKVAQQYSLIDKAAKDAGSKLAAPFMTLSFMALLVIPSLKLTDVGLVDVEQFRFVHLFV